MKGIFIYQGVEHQLNIEGESWPQNSEVNGSLEVINRSSNPYSLNGLAVVLARGDYKKIKAKKEDAFIELEKNIATDKVLSPGDVHTISFQFPIRSDYGITDKKGSLYMSCVDGNQSDPIGSLALQITPLPILQKTTELIEQFLRFKVKEFSSKKDFLTVKFITPKSKEYGSIDQMEIHMRLNEKNLDLQYHFNLKKLQMVGGEMEMSKEKRKIDQTLSEREYLMGPDFLNQDRIIESVKEVLDQVKSKNIF